MPTVYTEDIRIPANTLQFSGAKNRPLELYSSWVGKKRQGIQTGNKNPVHGCKLCTPCTPCRIQDYVAFGIMSHSGLCCLVLCRWALCCIRGYVIRHNVAFGLMSLGIVSFGVMSFGVLSDITFSLFIFHQSICFIFCTVSMFLNICLWITIFSSSNKCTGQPKNCSLLYVDS